MHTLVIGMTESGKTTLVKWLTKSMKKRGVKVAVLDPLMDPEWDADFITDKSDEFLKYVKTNKQHVLVVDESGSAIGRYNEAMNWLATTSRHLGHSTFFIMQGATQVDPIVRGQCRKCFMFTCAGPIAKNIAIEYNEPKVSVADKLKKGEFYMIDRFSELVRGRVDWDSQDVKIEDVPEGVGTDSVTEQGESNDDTEATKVKPDKSDDSGNTVLAGDSDVDIDSDAGV